MGGGALLRALDIEGAELDNVHYHVSNIQQYEGQQVPSWWGTLLWTGLLLLTRSLQLAKSFNRRIACALEHKA